MTTSAAIEVSDLVINYRRKDQGPRAVDGLSFTVEAGECVGFIGANGAGKSSTIKAIMGFIRPTEGKIEVFGESPGSTQSRQHVGYLPEVALYYPFMKARELLELYGGLHDLDRRELKKRIPQSLEEVGLKGQEETLLKNYSKGMQQRLGIAQALISSPKLLILDEMSSGLDPMGRADLRKLLLSLKAQGRTIFFSSHELTEVESLCDRVLMIHKGKRLYSAKASELAQPLNSYRVVFSLEDSQMPAELLSQCLRLSGNRREFMTQDIAEYASLLQTVSSAGGELHSIESKHHSLEDYFLELVKKEGEA